MQVVAVIHERDGAYTAAFPDFPGCTATATDADELMVEAAAALARHVNILIENDQEWPQLRSLSRLANDPAFLASSTGALIALIPYTPGIRAVRLAITFDQTLLAEIDRAAEAAGQSRSDYLAESARQRLARDASDPDEPNFAPRVTTSQPSRTKPPADAEASLERIRETLERLDRAPPAPEPIPQLRPAKQVGQG
jgi:predicted RNase H-like HicB family nuclease